jgi:hypothetical protein
LDDAVGTYNRTAAAKPDEAVSCNPLLSRLLLDCCNNAPLIVPAIQRVATYYKALPEFSERGWKERRAGILGEDFAGFHSTLAEISLHEALATIPGLSARFIDPESGGRRRADYEIRVGDAVLEAEFKSILSEQVRLPEGTRFGGIHVDPSTARAVWRKFTEPIRERQLDASRPAAIFVDISMCDELYMFWLSCRQVTVMNYATTHSLCLSNSPPHGAQCFPLVCC